jgi:hypothetical protein
MGRINLWRACLVALAIVVAVAVPQAARAQFTALTVPLVPTSPTLPHFTYPVGAGSEITIVLGATVVLNGDTNPLTYAWNFGDGTLQAAAPVTNPYNISATHQYPSGAAGGTQWTAVVTVTDTVTSATSTANYYVVQQANNLASRVDVAIDSGLWYLHANMWRCSGGSPSGCGTGTIYGASGNYGGWDCYSANDYPSCGTGYFDYYTLNASAVTGVNVTAFEVNSHYANGPASDPYTNDVALGLNRIFMFLQPSAVTSKSYNYNIPGTACPNGGTTACAETFDVNSNGQMLADIDYWGYPYYQGGQMIDAIVASADPTATATTGVAAGGGLPGVQGQTYQNIVDDMIDQYDYCQNNYATSNDYSGSNYGGGAWAYQCNVNAGGSYNDNSVSQWAAIGEIAANSSVFAVPIPQIIKDANLYWLTGDQCSSSGLVGEFGYSGACSEPWGPYAVTPSGLVQLAMDQKGRGDSRWNAAESYYHDNFCNAVSGGTTASPRDYTYGLFSFTKSMLLHDPGGVLTPITFLEDLSGTSTTGTNPIDWYNAVGSESGGTDACDGVAQVLVKRQGTSGGVAGGTPGSPNPSNPQYGYWEGHYYDAYQDAFETGWSVIMLNKTVFVACVNNLVGQGTKSGIAAARIDLTWTGIAGAASYNVLIGPNGGTYTKIGNTTLPSYSDRSGLTNGNTYYFVLQPLNNSGTSICQSNQATVTVP